MPWAPEPSTIVGLMSYLLSAGAIAIVLIAARVGGFVAIALDQPRVLGELAVGLLLGNLALVGLRGLEFVKLDPAVDTLSRIAILVLMFHAGVEATVGEMKKVGVAAFVVAACGVVGSFAATWVIARLLLRSSNAFVQVFVAASLTATSVGVTARVLRDLGHARSSTAHVILAAAVFDDIVALIVLALMSGSGSVAAVLVKASVFLVGGLALGMAVSPRLLSFASRSMAAALLGVSLAFCFAMAWLASVFGLAAVVGAFAAGLVVEEAHYRDFIDRRERTLDDLLSPLLMWVVPVFFVVVGMRTNLAGLKRPDVLLLAAALTAAAVVGKQLCALGVTAARAKVDRLAVGLGMMPRGEVTLIFANLGAAMIVAGRPVIDTDTFLALVITVIATTLLTPVALKWRLGVSSARRRS
jgi:Kef-type K+ transport system membrane component KefB